MLEDDFDEDELDTVFGSWQRSGGMELRLTRNCYKGDDIVDLRLWLGNGKPTRKDVMRGRRVEPQGQGQDA